MCIKPLFFLPIFLASSRNMKAGRNAFVLVLATSLLGLGGVGVLASAGRAQGGELLAQTAKQLHGHPRCSIEACGRHDPSTSWVIGGVSTLVARRTAMRVRGGAVVSDQYNARMQVMITRNMRKVLIDELDYLADEVDDMDPQIAAVVIEKSLPRPRAGMPIAWRQSIRHTGSSPNPVRILTGAFQGVLEGAVSGVLAVVTFPFVTVRKGVGLVRRGGAKGAAATVMVLGLAAVLVISRPAGEDADDMYPAASGLRMLGDNLVAARARLSRGRGDGKAKSNNVPPSARENRGGANKSGAATAKPGGRWFGAEGRSKGASEALPDEGGQKNDGGNFRDSSSSFADSHRGYGGDEWRDEGDFGNGGERDDGFENQGGWSGFGSKKQEDNDLYSGKMDQQQNKQRRADGAGSAAGSGGRRNKKGASSQSPNDLPRFNGGGPQKNARVGGGMSGNGDSREASASVAALENRRSGKRTGDSSTSSSSRPQPSSEPKIADRHKVRASSRGDEEEVCPDAPVSASASGAVWFEDLPPAPPAPETIGVLDDEEDVGALEDPERRPRWGRKPMSEHIPSEEEMDTWNSKIEASDTWLDRGINKVMGSLFGGRGDGDSSKE